MSNIQAKVVMITGASSGIGEAVAKDLASKGAKLVLAARREDRLKSIQEEIQKNGGQAIYKVTDVTSHVQMEELAELALHEFGKIDVLVNNAGVMPQSFLYKKKVDEWDKMIDVNIKGVLYGIGAVLPMMREQKSGHIINLSSVAGHSVFAGSAVYCATKHAVKVISEALRQEEVINGTNIRVTTISPGAIRTELTDGITDTELKPAYEKLYNIAISPESIVRAITFAIEEPEEVSLNEITVRPTKQRI